MTRDRVTAGDFLVSYKALSALPPPHPTPPNSAIHILQSSNDIFKASCPTAQIHICIKVRMIVSSNFCKTTSHAYPPCKFSRASFAGFF